MHNYVDDVLKRLQPLLVTASVSNIITDMIDDILYHVVVIAIL